MSLGFCVFRNASLLAKHFANVHFPGPGGYPFSMGREGIYFDPAQEGPQSRNSDTIILLGSRKDTFIVRCYSAQLKHHSTQQIVFPTVLKQ